MTAARRQSSRVLATVPLDHRSGGVAAVSRLVWQAFREKWGDDAALLTLRENDNTPLGWRDKLRFGAQVMASQLRGRARWLFFGHVGPARVQSKFPPHWQRPYGVFLHGVEVWSALSEADRTMLRRAGLRMANSNHTAKRLTAMNEGVGDIVVCPLSMSAEQEAAAFARPASPHGSREPVVLMVGRLNAAESYKGHAEMIEAWPAVVRRYPDARLVIAGEGDDRGRLEALAASTGVGAAIRFAGFVSNDELFRLYDRSSLFALPSRGEGFGIVYLEAMAHGLPCLASVHDAAGDVVADGVTGFLVAQDDRAQIVDRVVTLLSNSPLRQTMGEAGIRRVRGEFSFARFAAGLTGALESHLESVA